MATETITPTTTTDLVELDLHPILFKMECEGERLHGEPIDPDVAERDYRRFLTLHRLYPEVTLVPSALIDLIWHYHILDTRKYGADCDRIFGYFLHHDPYFGTGSEESRRENMEAWEATLVLWEKEFGEPLLGPSHRCSTKDCR
jgi:hypothetical protein